MNYDNLSDPIPTLTLTSRNRYYTIWYLRDTYRHMSIIDWFTKPFQKPTRNPTPKISKSLRPAATISTGTVWRKPWPPAPAAAPCAAGPCGALREVRGPAGCWFLTSTEIPSGNDYYIAIENGNWYWVFPFKIMDLSIAMYTITRWYYPLVNKQKYGKIHPAITGKTHDMLTGPCKQEQSVIVITRGHIPFIIH